MLHDVYHRLMCYFCFDISIMFFLGASLFSLFTVSGEKKTLDFTAAVNRKAFDTLKQSKEHLILRFINIYCVFSEFLRVCNAKPMMNESSCDTLTGMTLIMHSTHPIKHLKAQFI